MSTFFYLPNLVTQATTISTVAPWDRVAEFDAAELDRGDAEYERWINNNGTANCFYSLMEPLSPGLRVSKAQENPVYRMHGLVVDYDTAVCEADVQRWAANAPCGYLPAYACVTRSHGSRLVWLFEAPVEFMSVKAQLHQFIVALSAELKLTHWVPALDSNALENHATYYQIGRKWYPVSPQSVIPKAQLDVWMFKAVMSGRVHFGDGTGKKETIVDMAFVEKALRETYPGRWTGPVSVGSRGVTVWEAESTNATSCVILKDGMYSFSSSPAFRSWRSLFGHSFMQQVEADKMAGLVENTAYDGLSFYMFDPEKAKWLEQSRGDFSQQMRVRGFSTRRDEFGSELDRAEVKLKSLCRVHRALPFLYFKSGFLQYGGEKYLNISSKRVIPPQELPLTQLGQQLTWLDGRRNFPFIWALITNLLAPQLTTEADPGPGDADNEYQLTLFLAWLKHFYETSYLLTPTTGCTMALIGNVGLGKTFLSRRVVGDLMGGGPKRGFTTAAESHLLHGKPWTAALADSPLMAVDDAIAANDFASLTRFAGLIKAYSANGTMQYEEKNVRTANIPWLGRPFLTGNTDPESLRILPSTDLGNRDKVIMLHSTDCVQATTRLTDEFEANADVEQSLARELPKLGRWLLDWKSPPEMYNKRFGVKAWQHPKLVEATMQIGDKGLLVDILLRLIQAYCEKNDKTFWEGSSAELYEAMQATSPAVMRSISYRQFTYGLAGMVKAGYKLRPNEGRSRTWRVELDLFGPQANGTAK